MPLIGSIMVEGARVSEWVPTTQRRYERERARGTFVEFERVVVGAAL